MSGKRLGIAEALREGIAEEMRRDPRVFCIGEDIGIPGGWGGAFTVTLGLEKEFAERIGARVGTILDFDVQGVPLRLKVTSLRTVDWRTFGINFFLVVEPLGLARLWKTFKDYLRLWPFPY